MCSCDPQRLPQSPDYPAHFEVRKVSTNGGIRWNCAWINVSHLFGGEYIGLEEVHNDDCVVSFGPVTLGWLDEADYRIMDVKDRARRRR